MVNKKAFLRTMEVVFAIVIVVGFLLIMIPSMQNRQVQNLADRGFLEQFRYDLEFQQCVLEPTADCFNETIGDSMKGFDHVIIVTDNVYELVESASQDSFIYGNVDGEYVDVNSSIEFPKKRVFSESFMVAGNETLYDPVTVRIFYWHG